MPGIDAFDNELATGARPRTMMHKSSRAWCHWVVRLENHMVVVGVAVQEAQMTPAQGRRGTIDEVKRRETNYGELCLKKKELLSLLSCGSFDGCWFSSLLFFCFRLPRLTIVGNFCACREAKSIRLLSRSSGLPAPPWRPVAGLSTVPCGE